MYWWLSDDGLTIDTIVQTPLQDFDYIAGRIVFEMRQKFPEQICLSKEQHLEIAAQLDELKQYRPIDVLPGDPRKELAAWNQKNGQKAIDTFVKAVNAVQPRGVHRQTLKRLYRAEEKFKRQQRTGGAAPRASRRFLSGLNELFGRM
jgi:hypothetical protein